MTATPSPKGVEPKEPEPSALDVVVARHSDLCSAALLCLTNPEEVRQYCDCGTREALVELATLTAERDEAQKRAEVAEAENKRLFAGMLAMMNTNQARAQSAAQSTAKIAQDLQNFLREHTSDVVKLEA